MTEKFRLALAQLNPTVGAIESNANKAKAAIAKAKAANADMIAFPEMFLSGYPVQDLVTKTAFVKDCMQWVGRLARAEESGMAIGIGGPCLKEGRIYNAYFVLADGAVKTTILKHHLPFLGVFDEMRQFAIGPISGPYKIGPAKIGNPICEDAWFEDVCETHAESGAEMFLVPNGSPYYRGKMHHRINAMVARVVENGLPLAYLNMVGGQDDQVFDGGSFVLNRGGALALQLPCFDELVEIVEFTSGRQGWSAKLGRLAAIPNDYEQDYRAMAEGLRDYVRKSGFRAAMVGLSGGIDSALVATLSVDALGADNTRCVLLPSVYTSRTSREDAAQLASRLGCRFDVIEIAELQRAVGESLGPLFDGLPADSTEENVQARLRGLLLMAISNKFGELLLTTGNKSEAAVGYATIYGDMAGGYNPIKDLYKSRVFETCRWRNESHRAWMKGPAGEVVPENIIVKPPTAELRPNQKDSDSLPPYEVLDCILEKLIDGDQPISNVVSEGFDLETVKRVEQMIYRAEYKRFQSAPGVRLTEKALWLDRRYPIVNLWRDSGLVD
ncbi:MAG: NAD+ synthase [Rhodobacteraceae bacterium]|nr:NAD+ synthase [Paracoccaceae bacterium]